MTKIKLLTPVILAILASCSSKGSSDNNRKMDPSFTYTIDTVRIDAGEEFIYLNNLLTSSGESPDGKYLYNFNRNQVNLEVINLESMTLEKIIPYEKEGPNGIGPGMISKVKDIGSGKLILSDNYQVSMVDLNGKKQDGFVYAQQEFVGEKLPAEKRIRLEETFSKDGKLLVALYGGQKIEDTADGLAIFDLEKKQVRYHPLTVFKELEKYQTVFYYEGVHPIQMYMADIKLHLKGDSLIYSNTAQNKVYFFQLSSNTLSSKSYTSKFTSQEAEGNYPKRSDNEAEFKEITKEKEKEVNFGRFFFDDQNNVYWRFSREMKGLIGDSIVYKTVLTAFDPNFNQLHEELLPGDFVLPQKYFARKGMIYTFLNIEDELAFVRLKPNFENE
ncbi:DUF4221 family protein [Algoriphagus aestuarii]|nr:DUF4221 family protein [Algoriphagus aestuarii]